MTIPTGKNPNDAFAYLLSSSDENAELMRTAVLSDFQVGLPEKPSELQLTGRISYSSAFVEAQPSQTIYFPPDATIFLVSILPFEILRTGVAYSQLEDLKQTITVILPQDPRIGQVCYIKDASGTADVCAIKIQGSKIDGSDSKLMNYKDGCIGFVWTGAAWSTLSDGNQVLLDDKNSALNKTIQDAIESYGPATTDPSYIVLSSSPALPNERVLTAGSNITITDGGPGGSVTISSTGGGGGGSGDVVGPASSTTNAIAKYTDTTGKLLSNTSVTIDASNNVTVPGRIIVTGGTTSATDATLGNAAVGSFPYFDGGGSSGVYAMFGHKDLDHSTAVTNYAIYQDNTGNTAINASNDKSLILSVNNTIMGFLTNNLLGTGIDAISLTGETSTKTNMALGNTTLDSATTIYAGTGDLNVGHNSADRNVNLGTGNNASNQDVVVGSTYDRSSLLLRAGTGNMLLTGAVSTDYTVGGPGGTGTITLGRSKSTNRIDIGNAGNSTSFTQTVNIAAGTGTSDVTIGSKSGTSPMVLQAGTSGLSVSGSARFNQGLSGSLTKLVDGTSYLIAGSNITISSASNGAVTISSAGGTPGGLDTYVQFNDGGSFGGDSGLTYNKTTDTLTISGDLNVNGGDQNTTASTFNLLQSASILNICTTAENTVNIGTGASLTANTQTINAGTGAGRNVVTVGSVSSNALGQGSSLTLLAGTGNMLLSGTTNTTYTVGSELGTGEIRVGRSTANNTVSIANGATSSGNTQLINIGNATGTGGVATISIASSSLGLKKVYIGRIDSGYLTGGTPGSEVYIGGNSIKIGDNDGATRSTILITGSITCRGVTTSTADLQAGAAEIGSFPAYTADPTVFAMFGHATLNHGALGNYALLQSSVGATALNAASGQAAYFRNNNNDLGLCSDGLMTFTGRAGVTTTTLLGNDSYGSATGLYGGTGGVYITGSFGTPYYIGGETSTGSIVIGRSTSDQSINIGNVSTTSPSTTTTTINIGTAGVGFSRNIIGIGNYSTSSPQGEGQSTTTIFGDTISIGTSGTPTTTIGSSQDASSIRINAGSGGITLSGSGAATTITGSTNSLAEAFIGTAEIGELPWSKTTFPGIYAMFGHKALDHTGLNYALVQSSTGDTFLNAPSSKSVFIANNGNAIAQIDTNVTTFTGSLTTRITGNSTTISGSNSLTLMSRVDGGSLILSGTSIMLTGSIGINLPGRTPNRSGIHIKQRSDPSRSGTAVTDNGAALRIEDDDGDGWIIGAGTDNHLWFSWDLSSVGGDGGASTIQAYINSAANAFTLMNFTGQHRCVPAFGVIENFNDKSGLIVVASGDYLNPVSGSTTGSYNRNIGINDATPTVQLASARNDKRAFGIVSMIEDVSDGAREFSVGKFVSVLESGGQEDNRVFINAIGEGAIWVCNINGNLENGDYITTCEIPGYGMKQDDDLLHNYTVAKITCDCDFTLDNGFYQCEEFQHEGVTYRRAFVGCTYHCG